MSLLKAESRTPGVKWLSFDGRSPGIGYDNMIVLEWLPEQQSTTYEKEGQGKLLYWAPRGQKGTTTDATGPDGRPLKPVMHQPVLVWVPGPDGKGLRDPEIEGDFGVRIVIFGAFKDLTKKMGASMEQGGRTTGIMELGDVIGAKWIADQGSTKLYATQFKATAEQTATLGAKIKAKFDAWQEARQREAEGRPSALAASNGGASVADDPRGWSTGGAAQTPEPVGAATGGGLFDDAPF